MARSAKRQESEELGAHDIPGEAVSADTDLAPEAIAYRLCAEIERRSDKGLLIVTRTAERAEAMARAVGCFRPEFDTLVLPPWSCLPYDRVSPSRESMGRRMAALQRLLSRSAKPVIIASVDAALQRVPPRSALRDARFTIASGTRLEREALGEYAARTGYLIDDRVDEPGEIAFRGGVVDIFPADASTPFRLMLDEEDRIEEILLYDPLTQRTEESVAEILLRPASELIHEEVPNSADRPGAEHELPNHYKQLEHIFGFLPQAPVFLEPGVGERVGTLWGQIEEAHGAAREFGSDRVPTAPDLLYLDPDAWDAAIAGHPFLEVSLQGIAAVPQFVDQPRRGAALAGFLAERHAGGRRVVLAGTKDELRALTRMLARTGGPELSSGESWTEALESAPATLSCPLETGFDDGISDVVLISGPDVLGRRQQAQATVAGPLGQDMQLSIGDVVVHEDHGVGILQAVETIEVDGSTHDVVRLEYHGGASALVPVEEFGRLWRYGGDPEAVTLDRLHTEAWKKRRAEVSAAIDEAAQALAELARARLETKVEPVVPPAQAFRKLSARFPYQETPDQMAAITAVLEDLRSGRAMDRLVCGDVGYGKTEVALRAAAAVALSGRQVAFVAPTTVLVRQHLQNLERRFAGTEIRIGHLSRLASPKEAAEVKRALAEGELDIVVGTHAVAGESVEFADLGLVIIDEEQRFGARVKQKLRELAAGVHVLALSATPIPRTLQSVLAGLQDVSVIATPPARRRAIRTFVAEFDAASARLALLRERRRGGQSFFVVPRIEDIEPTKAKLEEIAPELSVSVAHGELAPTEIDEALVDFSNGQGDVLLATNIVESGLDVPRANTMLIWRADRFGLAQLHQLRGRVGRGAAQGVAYLFTAPGEEVSEATHRRLSTLETLDRLGSGFAISARDLDQRGAGDLLGEEQAGHVQLIGAGLYQSLLERALRQAKGERNLGVERAEVKLGLTGAIPADYVPEPTVRIGLYARLQRITDPTELTAFADELEDRFGELPPSTVTLLGMSRLALTAGAAGIAQVDAGPLAIALTFRKAPDRATLERLGEATWSEDRLILKQATTDQDRIEQVSAVVAQLGQAERAAA